MPPPGSERRDRVYDPDRHEALVDAAWDAERARATIDAIVGDFVGARAADGSWPTHPWDVPAPRDGAKRAPKWAAYMGAAGAISSLRQLRAIGVRAPDLSADLGAVHAAWLREPDFGYEAGLQQGEVGILAPALLGDPGDLPLRARLDTSMRAAAEHPAREITSGATGMLHAAATLFGATGDAIWREHFLRGADALWASWERGSDGRWLWHHDIFGSVRRYYGACHGVAGNAGALLRGAAWLPEGRVAEILARSVPALETGALRDGADCNWPVSPDPSGTRRLVQWCHGAPGVVAALADAPDTGDAASADLDRLLLAAGEFTWRAGPLRKGANLCHGTAGNGWAFLALHRRTGDPRWLARARRFAMHACGQWRRARERTGQGRYTLWTGDGGLALFLADCIAGAHRGFPGLERF